VSFSSGFTSALPTKLALFGKRAISLTIAESLGLYEYWGYVHPYYDPRIPLDRLVRLLEVAKSLGVRMDLLLESPYSVYLLRMMAKKMGGEA
jgi:hypothetical protein